MNTTPTPTPTTLPTLMPTTVDSLLTHADWVRALARHLVRDPQTADDVEQEVWREAFERPPAHDANPRGWLASVARNAARQLKRGESRRTRREAIAARAEALPSTADLVEEASLSRELVGVVLQLDEPYRTTLLLRYFRDLSIDDIATAQNLSRETVRTRQRRALEMLRERLDATRGGRENWLAAFAPLARVEVPSAAVASSAAGVAWLWFAAATTAAAITWLAWPERGDRSAAAEVAVISTPGGTAVRGSSEVADAKSPLSDAAAATTAMRAPVAPAPEAAPKPARATRVIDLRVIDTGSRPVPGFGVEYRLQHEPTWSGDHLDAERFHAEIPAEVLARLRANPAELEEFLELAAHSPGLRESIVDGRPPRPSAKTDADGRLHVELGEGDWTEAQLDPRWTVVGEIRGSASGVVTWIVAHCAKIAGDVVDDEGRPIPSAHIQVEPAWELSEGFAIDPAETFHRRGTLVTNADGNGQFEIACAPLGCDTELWFSAPDHESKSMRAPEHDTATMRVVLGREAVKAVPHLRGVVLDVDGKPASGAWVQLGQDGESTDESGRFDIALSCCHDGAPLTATKAGFQAAIQPDFGRAKMETREDVVLRLGGPPLSITGRVVDASGRPIPGCHVQLLDGTPAGTSDRFVEDVSGPSPESSVRNRRTGDDGRFQLDGLLSREYTLIAWLDEGGLVARVESVRAGTVDLVLRRDSALFHSLVRGRLVDGRGAPIADASVSIALTIFQRIGTTSSHLYARRTTDANGAFELKDVPRQGARLWIAGTGVRTESVALPESLDAPITLVAHLELRVDMTVADETIDSVQFLDAAGKVLYPVVRFPGTRSTQEYVGRREGVFPPFDLTDDAVTAVLRRAGHEVRRAPVDVRRGSSMRLQL